MRKKILGFMVSLCLVFTGVFLSACGDKYENFEYNIEYAFSADSQEWFDADNGVMIFHSPDDENLQYSNTGRLQVFFRVNIENVDDKDVGTITITGSSLEMTAKVVNENEVFSIDVDPRGKYNSSLTFTENNSRKTKSISFVSSPALKSIEVDTSIKPAITVGSSIDLAGLDNLDYISSIDGANTLQTAVSFELASFGTVVNGQYSVSVASNLTEYASLNGSVLTLNAMPTNAAYIAQIQVKSIYNANVEPVDFYVYLVDVSTNADSSIFTPTVFDSADETVTDVTLYTTSAGVENPYASKLIRVDVSSFNSLYAGGVEDFGGTLEYDMLVLIEGQPYVLNSISPEGLIVRLNSVEAGVYTYELIATQEMLNDIDLTFKYSLSNSLKFSSSEPNYQTSITVNRRLLPNILAINDVSYTDGQVGSGIQYSNSNLGVRLTIEALPSDEFSDYNIGINAENVEFSLDGINYTTDLTSVKSGTTFYARLANNLLSEQTITFSVRSTPLESELDTVSVNYTIRRIITANDVEIFSQYVENETGNRVEVTESDAYIDANSNTALYFKTYFPSGATLDETTVRLSLPETSSIRFSNGSHSITLADTTCVTRLSDNSNTYNVYQVLLTSSGEEESNVRLDVVAGDETSGVSTYVILSSKIIANTDTIQVKADGRYANDFSTTEGLKFALIRGTSSTFVVSANVLNNNLSNGNPIIDVECADNQYTNFIQFIGMSNNTFVLTALNNTTTSVRISIRVYYYTSGNVAISQESRVIDLEIVVYDTIDSISLSRENKDITFINSQYNDAAEIEVNFSGRTSTSNNVTSSIQFEGEEARTNVNQISVTLAESSIVGNSVEFALINNDGTETKIESGDAIMRNGNNVFEGTLVVRLTGPVSSNSISIIFSALRFGEVSINQVVQINIADYERADRIEVDGDAIVEEGYNNYWIYMSFLSVEDGGYDETKFEARAGYENNVADDLRFDDLTYRLYRVSYNDRNERVETLVTTTTSGISVIIENDEVTIRAEKSYGGGIYRLELATLDSYYFENGSEGYSNTFSLNLRVSDGTIDYAYTISNGEELMNINNDLTANYILIDNINLTDFTPIGGEENSTSVYAFEGSLDGTNSQISTAKNSITITISRVIADESRTYAGLFARLASTATISNIDIYVTFDLAGQEINRSLYLGALAGINQGGTVENVGVTLVQPSNTLDLRTDIGYISNSTINFGFVVGSNQGTINLGSSLIIYDMRLETISPSVNFGAVAGENSGTINGDATNMDLTSINYSIISNLNYINYGNGTSVNIGSVAGRSTGNGNTISNLMIGGILRIYNTDIAGSNASIASANLGGLAGTIENSTIDNCYTIGLDLISEVAHNIAGVAGSATSSNISNAHVISARVDFDAVMQGLDTVLNEITTTGHISGTDRVAGFVASSNATIINLSTIENFVSGNYTIIGGANSSIVGAFIADGNATVTQSFMNANIMSANNSSGSVTLIPENTENSYFIGQINGISKENISTNNLNNCYSIISVIEGDLNNFYYNGASSWNLITNDFEPNSLITDYDTNIWRVDSQYNAVTVVINTEDAETGAITSEEKVFYLPYLLKDGIPLQIIAPESISASINSDYIILIDSVYEDDYNGEYSEQDITTTAIINYHNYVQNTTENNRYNTYKITDLVDFEVIPSGAAGGIRYSIVSGSSYAYINADNEIVFTGVSGKNRIVVRCQSIFNEQVVEYVAFYTQIGLSGLTIDANNVYLEETDTYSITTYSGSTNNYITINAENIFGEAIGLNNLEFQNIFETNLTDYLSFSYESDDDLEGITISLTANYLGEYMIDLSNFTFEGDSIAKRIKFTLYFNAPDYYGTIVKSNGDDTVEEYLFADDIKMGEVNLIINIRKSANNIVVNQGQQALQTSASANFSVDLYTGYVYEDENYLSSQNVSYRYDELLGRIELYETGINKDSIYIEIGYDLEDLDYLKTVLNETNTRELSRKIHTELFNYRFTYVAIDANGNETSDITQIAGYRYGINLSIKEEYRYFTNSIEFIFTISAYTNEEVNATASITYEPTIVSTVRLENYNATNVVSNGGYISLITGGTTSSYIITPGGYGGLMVIHLEPWYSNVLSATLESSSINVNGTNVTLRFEQLVYNESTGLFQSLLERNVSNNGILDLRRVSQYSGTTPYDYNGIIYVRVFLEDRFAGVEEMITATLDVKSSETTEKTITTSFLTQYLPGVSLTYDGISLGNNEYLIQEGTFNNTVDLTIYGYQYNSQPIIAREWVLPEQDTTASSYYKYGGVDGNDHTIVIYMEDGEEVEEYNINSHITVSTGSVTSNTNGSYTIPITMTISAEIPFAFKLTAQLVLVTTTGTILNSEEDITFHPTSYIVDNSATRIERTTNDILQFSVNRTRTLEFVFETENNNYDYSDEIYKKLVDDISAESTGSTGMESFARLFSLSSGSTLADANTAFSISYVDVAGGTAKRIAIQGLQTLDAEITFSVNYTYVFDETTGRMDIKFTTGVATYNMSFTFRLIIVPGTSQEHATAIYSADDIFDPETNECLLNEGEDYILMNDITLTNLIPIDVAIASLDGNNKIITITSFASPAETATDVEYGLFASIGLYTLNDETFSTVLKNVVVDYGELTTAISFVNSNATNITFGGLVGRVEEGGLIYNCDVMNFGRATKEVTLLFRDSSEVNVVFGGLVGENSGTITNSRVGRIQFTRVSVSDSGNESVNYNYGPINPIVFNVGDPDVNGQGFVAIAGGFVGINNGKIASSYVANTSLISSSTTPDDSRTAGFVAENNTGASIMYSYVKALESTVSAIQPYSTGARIENLTNGSVAGFVHYNAGTINNAYANTELRSKSTMLAGFVFENASSGVISETYAACTFNGKLIGASTTAEQPFVGYVNAELLSYGTIENSYYLVTDGTRIDTNKVPSPENQDQAIAVSQTNFQDPDFLTNFVFVLSTSLTSRNLGVWSYYTLNSSYRILPELMSANTIATSYRRIVAYSEDGNEYEYAYSFDLGSANNPYTIQSVEEFNNILYNNGYGVNGEIQNYGYYRLISDIDFGVNSISTRLDYRLGDSTNSNITSFEGNGMTISGIYLDAGENVGTSIGLFANIENAYIRNLNLEFRSGFSSANITYAGGLAGQIKDSVIININLSGSGTTINGTSFAGGLAGSITGSSLVYGIKSNVNAVANNETSTFYTGDISSSATYSYAGGIVGLIDTTPRSTEDYNFSYIEVNGEEMTLGTNYDANVRAVYAGGITGYAGSEVKAFRLKFNTGNTNHIRGQEAAGGLFGAFLGELNASQVTAQEDIQYTYDTVLGEYVISLDERADDDGAISLDNTNIGNTALLEGYNFVGGIAGIGLNSRINNSYAKVSVYAGVSVGGLIGLAMSPLVNQAYAVSYIDLNNIEYYENVGGLYGEIYEKSYAPEDISGYAQVFNSLSNSRTYSSTTFAFATIIMDDSLIASNADEIVTESGAYNKNFNYIAGYYGQPGRNYLHGIDGGDTLVSVYGGGINYSILELEGEGDRNLVQMVNNAIEIELCDLYDNSNTSIQAETYQRMFASWSTEYWTLDSTRYFPLLLDRMVVDYYEISQDNLETALEVIKNNPSSSYKIIEDLDFDDIVINGNFIIEVGGDGFSGILIGEKEDGTAPTLRNLKVNATKVGDAGFFDITNGATISNINFEWESIQLNNYIIGYVGGVTAQDTGSQFNGLNVYMPNPNSTNSSGSSDSATNNSGDIISKTITTAESTISGFGGIVGSGSSSNIISCSFEGHVSARLMKDGDGVNVGAIIGRAEAQTSNQGGDYFGATDIGMIVADATVGSANSKTSFNFEYITSDTDEAKSINIGAAVGYAEDAAISGVYVGNHRFSDNQYVDLTIVINGNDNFYIGGMVGNTIDTQISSSNVLTNIKVSGSTDIDATASNVVAIGGFAGSLVMNSSISFRNNMADTSISVGNEGENDTVSTLTINTLRVSAGIAGIDSTGGNITLQQSLFSGTVTAKNEGNDDLKLNANYVWAGGAVGYVDSSNNLILEEIMSTADIFAGSVSGTKTLFAGGLIGSGALNDSNSLIAPNIEIYNSASTGRIVAVSMNEITDSVNIYLGGMVASSGNLTIDHSYSATSLLTDGLGKNSYNEANINAIVGKSTGTVEFNQTYYSSDIALANEVRDTIAENVLTNPSSTDGLFNVSAYELVLGNSWHNSFNSGNEGIWTIPTSTGAVSSYIPFITSLYEDLLNSGYMTTNLNPYTEGSVLNPKFIQNNNITLEEEYTFYLVSANITNALMVDTVGGDTTLNGILIAGEGNYNVSTVGSGTGTEYSAFIPTVDNHSAISNLHVKFDEGSTINASGSYSAIIAGTNNGVIFNSSVQGTGIEANGSTYFGVIAGQNNGLISHSYSSIEIVATRIGNISGIAVTNSGIMDKCYFTGYINNTGTAAGLIHNSSNGYIYNSYMGGVIETVSSLGNSFIGNFNALNSYGENNYIDKLANFDIQANTNDSITLANTLDIMTAEELGSGWDSIVGYYNPSNFYYIDMSRATYGYNYGYPVQNFHKVGVGLQTRYQLYTGNGTNSDTFNINDIGNASFIDNEVLNNENYYRIPHLGVLHTIQGLANTILNNNEEGTLKIVHTKLNYVLIYDIDVPTGEGAVDNLAVGRQLDTDSSSAEGRNFYLGNEAQFNGRFISNRYYKFEDYDSGIPDQVCKITGLRDDGLFTNINDAKFGYIFFGDANLSNSGALGVNIYNFDKTNVSVDHIWIGDDYGAIFEGNNVGGLFGTISNGTISISNLVTCSDANVMRFTVCASGYNGLIANQMTGGTITFGNSNSLAVNFEDSNSDEINGGLIGRMSGGEISGNNNEVKVSNSNEGKPSDVIGGLVGEVGDIEGTSALSDIQISNLIVKFISGDRGLSFIQLGGIIGSASRGEVTLSSITISSDSEINLIALEDAKFGLITAYLNGATITLGSGNKIGEGDLDIILSYTAENASTNQAYGVVVGDANSGTIEGTLQIGNTTLDTTTNSTNKTINVGGIAGRFGIATINLEVTNLEGNEAVITVYGNENVGGIFGRYEIQSGVTGDASFTLNKITSTVYGDYNVGGFIGYASTKSGSLIDLNSDTSTSFNYLLSQGGGEESGAYAEIHVLGSEYSTSKENIGGIFGYFNGNLTIDSATTIVNYNPIRLSADDREMSIITNIGGVAGSISGSISNARNHGSIGYENTGFGSTSEGMQGDSFVITNILVGSNANAPTYTLNIGGIVGKIEGSNIDGQTISVENISNSASVEGYQNVGGLIGYVSGVKIESASSSGGTVSGVLNVGGAFGYVVNGSSTTEISYVTLADVSVNGNSNVGGLIGLYTGGDIHNCTVTMTPRDNTTDQEGDTTDQESSSTAQETETNVPSVNGIYYKLITNNDSVGSELMNTHFIPTGVGGFIGTARKSSATVAGAIYNNDLANVNITSEQEGSDSATDDDNYYKTNTSKVISTVGNYMFAINMPASQDFDFSNIVEYNTESNAYLEFNSITTGYGGFIGSVNSYVTNPNLSIDGETREISTNEIQVDIEASLGVNVGAFYGYYYEVNSTDTLNLPTLLGAETKVSGAYNIGGIIGYYRSNRDTASDFSEISFTKDGFGTGEIIVQPSDTEITGMYVGGVFGKFMGNATGLKLGDLVKIDTTNAFYAGGLIGRLEGSLIEDEAHKNGIENGNNVVIAGSAVDNFGGLVGMLKVEAGTDGSANAGRTVNVIGTHKYAFTINTIENSNYADVATEYNDEKDGTDIYLTAIAGYVNQDHFVISATSDVSWYSASATNPLNQEETFGWAKDYTLFKTMQRCIPMDENGAGSVRAEWDAISIVYDASYITYVGTRENLNLSYNDSSDDEKQHSDYICFTIVESVEGQARLYSAIGQASIYYNADGEYPTDSDLNDETDVTEDNGFSWGRFWQWAGAVTGFNNPPQNTYYIDLAKNIKDLTYLDYDANYTTVNGRSASLQTTYNRDREGRPESIQSASFILYKVDNYFRLEEDTSSAVGTKREQADTYFQFDVFYENTTLVLDEYTSADHTASSGSLFEVNGVSTNAVDNFMANGENAYEWLVPVQILTWAVITVAGGGVTGLIGKATGKVIVRSFLKTVVKVVGKVVSTAGKLVGKLVSSTVGKVLGIVLLNVLTTFIMNQIMAVSQTTQTYISIREQTFGYLGPSYMRELRYDSEDKVYVETDQAIQDDYGNHYIYYSSTRPADYYSRRYYVYELNGYDESGNPVYRTWFETSIDSTRRVEDSTSDFYGAYDLDDRNGYAYDYYIYRNGVYFVILDAVNYEWAPVQLFDTSEHVINSQYVIEVYQNNSYYYVAGGYSNGTYSNVSRYGNNLDESKIVSSAGGFPTSVENRSLTFIPMADNDLSSIFVSIDTENDETVIRKAFNINDTKTYYKGYGYSNEAYYTANGSIKKTYAGEEEGQDIKPIVAEFTATTNPQGTPGIDYIELRYTTPNGDGENVTHTVYYEFTSINDGATGTDLGDFDINGTESSVYVNLYPYSLTNPYVSLKDGTYVGITTNDGETVYLLEQGVVSNNSISCNKLTERHVVYYYYEGGYTKGEDLGKTGDYAEAIYLETDATVFTLYDANGDIVYVSRDNLIAGNYSGAVYGYFVEAGSEDNVGVGDFFHISGDTIYQMSTDLVINNGITSTISVSYPNNESRENDYNLNKYLMNTSTELYTRYKYRDIDYFAGAWGETAYYTYQSGFTYPNPGNTTYLVEGCRVVLGGGGQYQDGDSRTEYIGSFTIR